MLEIPAAVHQFDGQPVEEFRVRGQLALRAEFLARADQSDTEDGFPQAVGDHTGGEGVPAVHQPAGQFQTTGARGSGIWSEGRGEPLRHLIAQVHPVAPQLKAGLAAILAGQFAQHGNRGVRLEFGALALQRGQTVPLGLEAWGHRPVVLGHGRVLGGGPRRIGPGERREHLGRGPGDLHRPVVGGARNPEAPRSGGILP